jgi:hypothetical protein
MSQMKRIVVHAREQRFFAVWNWKKKHDERHAPHKHQTHIFGEMFRRRPAHLARSQKYSTQVLRSETLDIWRTLGRPRLPARTRFPCCRRPFYVLFLPQFALSGVPFVQLFVIFFMNHCITVFAR